MRTTSLTALVAGAALALSACDDGTGTGDAALSRTRALQLHQAMLGVAWDVSGRDEADFNSSPATQQSGTGSFTFNFNDTAPCDPSGSVKVSGTVSVSWNEAAGTGGMSADVSAAHDGCAHRMQDGGVIELSGDPDIDITLDAVSGPQGPESITLTERGAFTWSDGEGNSGRCTIDLAAELDPLTGAAIIDGSFCGIDISGTYSGA